MVTATAGVLRVTPHICCTSGSKPAPAALLEHTSSHHHRTLSIRAPSVVVAVLMDSRSCARPHTTQDAAGGHVVIGCTSFPALACCCRNVFCMRREELEDQLHAEKSYQHCASSSSQTLGAPSSSCTAARPPIRLPIQVRYHRLHDAQIPSSILRLDTSNIHPPCRRPAPAPAASWPLM
jgi:hypothetical protein